MVGARLSGARPLELLAGTFPAWAALVLARARLARRSCRVECPSLLDIYRNHGYLCNLKHLTAALRRMQRRARYEGQCAVDAAPGVDGWRSSEKCVHANLDALRRANHGRAKERGEPSVRTSTSSLRRRQEEHAAAGRST